MLVFGEPEAKPTGYAHAPKVPAHNLQSVVDVESGLIVHHDVCNDANDSHLLHRMSVAAKAVLEADELHVLTDGGYSNAVEVARCEGEAIIVSAPIKRGAMNSKHFRPTQFVYDEETDTIRCPAGHDLRPAADSDDAAMSFRDHAASHSGLIPPPRRELRRGVDVEGVGPAGQA